MPGRLVSSLTQDLVHCPSGGSGGRQGKARTVQRLSPMGNTQPRDRDGTRPWAPQRRCCPSSDQTRGAARRGSGCLGRRGDRPSNTGWGVSPGNFLTRLLLGIVGKNQPHPLLFAYSPLGRGVIGLGWDWAPLGASVKYCTTALPKLTQDFPFLPSWF